MRHFILRVWQQLCAKCLRLNANICVGEKETAFSFKYCISLNEWWWERRCKIINLSYQEFLGLNICGKPMWSHLRCKPTLENIRPDSKDRSFIRAWTPGFSCEKRKWHQSFDSVPSIYLQCCNFFLSNWIKLHCVYALHFHYPFKGGALQAAKGEMSYTVLPGRKCHKLQPCSISPNGDIVLLVVTKHCWVGVKAHSIVSTLCLVAVNLARHFLESS